MTMIEDPRLASRSGRSVQGAADSMVAAMQANLDGLDVIARTAQHSVESSGSAVSALIRRCADQALRGAGLSDPETQRLASQVADALQNLTQANVALADAFEEVGREWLRLSKVLLRRNLDELNAFGRCRSTSEHLDMQRSRLFAHLEQSIETSRRFARIAHAFAGEIPAAQARTEQMLRSANDVWGSGLWREPVDAAP